MICVGILFTVICGVSFRGISVVGECKQAPGAEFLSRAFWVFFIVFSMEFVVANVVRVHEFSSFYLPQFISPVACTLFSFSELLLCESVHHKVSISLCVSPFTRDQCLKFGNESVSIGWI